MSALPGLWADLDVKGEAHKAINLPPTDEDAMRITEAIPLEPTLILHSGHGLQVWWLFKELWVFEGEVERKEAQGLSRRFQATLKEMARRYGWHMDGTHDISRIFRPPGTLNHKMKPVEVRVMRYDESARYNPADFEQYLVDVAPEGEHEVHFEGNGHDPEATRALLGLLRGRISGRILSAIEGGPGVFEPLPGGDGSSSGADASVCGALVEAGLTNTQIRSIFGTFPIGTKGKYAREGRRGDDYLARTIKRQREWVAENRKSVNIADDIVRPIEEFRPEEIGKLLSEVESEKVSWLWPSWLALGKLALVDGDPGLGKSAMTLDLAARVSAGKAFPDGAESEASGVVLLSAEDGLKDTIRPRLDAAGADTSKILSLAMVPDGDGHDRLLSIPEDLGLIEEGIRRVGARLVVVDPLMAFLSANTNSHRDQDVRRALAPLAGLAERTGASRVGREAPQQSRCQQPAVPRRWLYWHHRGGAHGVRGRQGPLRRRSARAGFHQEQPCNSAQEFDVRHRRSRWRCGARRLARGHRDVRQRLAGYTAGSRTRTRPKRSRRVLGRGARRRSCGGNPGQGGGRRRRHRGAHLATG